MLPCIVSRLIKKHPAYNRSILMGLMLYTIISLTCAVSALVCVIYENGKDGKIKPMDLMCNIILITICFFLFITELPIKKLDTIAATYYPMFSYRNGNLYATGLCQIALLFFILEGLDESQNTKEMLGGHYLRLYWAGGIIIGTSGFLNLLAAFLLSEKKTAKQLRFPKLSKETLQKDEEAYPTANVSQLNGALNLKNILSQKSSTSSLVIPIANSIRTSAPQLWADNPGHRRNSSATSESSGSNYSQPTVNIGPHQETSQQQNVQQWPGFPRHPQNSISNDDTQERYRMQNAYSAQPVPGNGFAQPGRDQRSRTIVPSRTNSAVSTRSSSSGDSVRPRPTERHNKGQRHVRKK